MPKTMDTNEMKKSRLMPVGENPVVNIEKSRWHSLECLEPGTVLFESKDGAWEPLGEEDMMRVTEVTSNSKI